MSSALSASELGPIIPSLTDGKVIVNNRRDFQSSIQHSSSNVKSRCLGSVGELSVFYYATCFAILFSLPPKNQWCQAVGAFKKRGWWKKSGWAFEEENQMVQKFCMYINSSLVTANKVRFWQGPQFSFLPICNLSMWTISSGKRRWLIKCINNTADLSNTKIWMAW